MKGIVVSSSAGSRPLSWALVLGAAVLFFTQSASEAEELQFRGLAARFGSAGENVFYPQNALLESSEDQGIDPGPAVVGGYWPPDSAPDLLSPPLYDQQVQAAAYLSAEGYPAIPPPPSDEHGMPIVPIMPPSDEQGMPLVPTVPPTAPTPLDEEQVQQIVKEYLEDHPGAGLPKGMQIGYVYGKGFVIRNTVPDPRWASQPECQKTIPFELRIRGRMQLDYYNFSVANNKNYQTGQQFAPFGGLSRRADFSALEVKRARLIFEGIAFNPNLKYRFQLNGDTRGLGGFFNNNQISTGSPGAGGAAAIGGGGVTTDHALRLFEAWVAYDMHPQRAGDASAYKPTYTLIAGKMKPFCGLEEFLGSGSDEFVEFSMADWFFSPDDDNLLMAAGGLVKAWDDRLYMMALITNGSESNFAANQIDDKPGFNGGLWYDFGGTWNEKQKAWQLFGDGLADIDTSEHPVVRVGAGANIASLDRRRLYGDAEQSRFRAAVGGARIIDILNGAGSANGLNAVDEFDAYTFNTFLAAKYCGWSMDSEFFVRYLNNFRTLPAGNNVILYSDFVSGSAMTSLFPVRNLTDYGAIFQGGYFIVPEKWELVGRYSMVVGQSGSINGNGSTRTVDGFRVVNDAFRVFHTANEYTLGVNWYIRKHLLKWQSDVGYYQGGTPASASAAGFVTNADGFLARTQLQLAF